MARVAYIAEIDPREVGALGYLAGMLTGQGIPQGQVLAAILDRIQLVEVPDDFGGLEADGTEPSEEPEVHEQEDNVVPLYPAEDEVVLPENATEVPGGELPHIDPLSDPTAPENLGIELNKPNPYGPTQGSGFANPEDFGAGPPPRQG